MRILAAICLTVAPLLAGEPPAGKPRLHTSDLSGKDLAFISSAAESAKTLTYLAAESRRAGSDVRSLATAAQHIAAQGAVLGSIAEIRGVRIERGETAAQKIITARLSKLTALRRDKALLEALAASSRDALSLYEQAGNSTDPTIRIHIQQALPQLRENLRRIQLFAGIPEDLPAIADGPSTTARQ